MTLEQAKKELIRRYKYLYENASFILTPYYKCKETHWIYINRSIVAKSKFLIEEFLLSDKPLEESPLYKIIEEKRKDKKYLEKLENKLFPLKELVNDSKLISWCFQPNIYSILNLVTDYVEDQSGDLNNKNNKLLVIDEYYRLLRYENNEKTYKSGRNLILEENRTYSMIIIPEKKPSREKDDIGITKNRFIITIANEIPHEYNQSIFTEEEKQKVYLELHDELPYDLAIKCTLEEEYIDTLIDSRLKRPDNTEYCGKEFYIKEQDIFINLDDDLYRYYQLCPHCGYIVNIPKEILSDSIKKRIEDRCREDNYLFRKMYLYSELFSLDNKTPEGYRKVLYKRK